jgi:anti-sigma B factor antagonist
MAARQDGLQVEQAPAQPGGPLVFRLAGTLDLTTVDRLRAVVGPACGSGGEIMLDLAGVDFCDSTGLGTLVWLHRQATGAGGRLLLAAPRRPVREILKISGVDRAIPVLGRNAANGPRRDGQPPGPARDGATPR